MQLYVTKKGHSKEHCAAALRPRGKGPCAGRLAVLHFTFYNLQDLSDVLPYHYLFIYYTGIF